MSRYMDAGYSGNCKAATCLHESRKIRRGDPIYWDTVERYAFHADCHRANIKFDQVLNAIANVSPVVCDLGDKEIDRKYAAAYNLLSSVYHVGARRGITPDTITTAVKSDIEALAEEATDRLPKPDRDTLRTAENLLTRAGLQASVNLGGIGYAASLEFHLLPWTLSYSPLNSEMHTVVIHFTNTWGGDDGWTEHYRVYCNHEVTGMDANRIETYKRMYILDQWARDIVEDAGIAPCSISASPMELVGYVLEVVGAIRSHGAVDGIPCEDYGARDLNMILNRGEVNAEATVNHAVNHGTVPERPDPCIGFANDEDWDLTDYGWNAIYETDPRLIPASVAGTVVKVLRSDVDRLTGEVTQMMKRAAQRADKKNKLFNDFEEQLRIARKATAARRALDALDSIEGIVRAMP